MSLLALYMVQEFVKFQEMSSGNLADTDVFSYMQIFSSLLSIVTAAVCLSTSLSLLFLPYMM